MAKIMNSYLDNVMYFGLPIGPFLSLIWPQGNVCKKRIKPYHKDFDYAVKTYRRTDDGKVETNVWQLKLTPTHARLMIIVNYYPKTANA